MDILLKTMEGEVNFSIVSTFSHAWKIKLKTPDPDIVVYLLSYTQCTSITNSAHASSEKIPKVTDTECL